MDEITESRIKGALDFERNSPDYVSVGGLDVEGSALTISAWFKAESFGSDPRIVSKASGLEVGRPHRQGVCADPNPWYTGNRDERPRPL